MEANIFIKYIKNYLMVFLPNLIRKENVMSVQFLMLHVSGNIVFVNVRKIAMIKGSTIYFNGFPDDITVDEGPGELASLLKCMTIIHA